MEAGIQMDDNLHDAAVWYGKSMDELEQKAASVGVMRTKTKISAL